MSSNVRLSSVVCRLSSVVCLSVCRLSVTFVHPTIRRLKFSAMFLRHLVRWPSVDIQIKFYGDRPRRTPQSGELNTRGVAEYSDFGPMEPYISHMSFRLVPNSVTLDDLERRNSPNRSVISPNSVAFGADYVKVVKDKPILSVAEM